MQYRGFNITGQGNEERTRSSLIRFVCHQQIILMSPRQNQDLNQGATDTTHLPAGIILVN